MIWNIIIIASVVLIFIMMARRIPLARQLQKKEIDATPEEITLYGLIAQADDAFDRKKFELAEKLYIQAAAQDPSNAKIYNRLGAIYLEQNNFYDAKDAFLQATRLDAGVASRYANLGLAYMGLKDYFKAGQTFKEALKIDPKNQKYQGFLEKSQKLQEKEKKRR